MTPGGKQFILAGEKIIMQLATADDYRTEQKAQITIRPINAYDKEKLFQLIRQRGTFNEKEIETSRKKRILCILRG